MKITKLIGLFLALFALVTIIYGCSSTDPDDDNKTTKPPANGVVYYAKASDDKYIILSIYSTPERAVTVKTGDNYALGISTNGVDLDGTWISEGTVTVGSDGSYTFKPKASSGQPNFKGSFIDGTLTLETVPGISDLNVGMTKGPDVVATPDNPLPPNFTLPEDPGDVNNNNNNNADDGSVIPPVVGGAYRAGKIVTEIKITTQPTWPTLKPAGTKYKEGNKLEFKDTGMVVKVTYSDGTTEDIKDNDIGNKFDIDPPTYQSNALISSATPIAGTHKLYWNKGFSNKETATISSTDYFNLTASISFNGPNYDNVDHINIESCLNPPTKYEGTQNATEPKILGILNEWLEDVHFFDYSPTIKLNVKYGASTAGTPFDLKPCHPVVLELTPSNDNYEGKLTVTLGAEDNVAVFLVKKVYNPTSIRIKRMPTFQQDQVLVDDPRLVFIPSSGTTLPKEFVNANWLSKMQDGLIEVSYSPSSRKRELSMVAAYNNNALQVKPPPPPTTDYHTFIEPPRSITTTGKVMFLPLKYYDCDYAGVNVNVFNFLSSVTVFSTQNPVPVIQPLKHVTAGTFLAKLVRVHVVYENGKGGTAVTRTDAYDDLLDTKDDKPGYKNQSSTGKFTVSIFDDPVTVTTSGTSNSRVPTAQDINDRLKTIDAKWKDGQGSPTKVTVTFSFNIKDNEGNNKEDDNGEEMISSKKGTIMVGAMGFY
jgi:hypothetical protein